VQEFGVTRNSRRSPPGPRLDRLISENIFRIWNERLQADGREPLRCDRAARGALHSRSPVSAVEAQAINVAALDPAEFGRTVERLAEILHACVHEGASIGFVMPFERSEARAYWINRVAPPHAGGAKLVLIATVGREIAGTAQLDLDSMPSKRHHAEVSKVLVDPQFRRAGVARALMREIERHATKEGRWLLTLDTAGDAAEALYRSLGYSLAGAIPNYARNAFEDSYDATRLMYKDLRGG
jgi:ribosomal protein S18 acetylase RimI-like enzyme